MVVLRHFVDAQRKGYSVDPAIVRLEEPYLRSGAISAFFEDLQRADLIQRSESGGWLLSRSLDATDLLRVYRYAGYRLPLDPADEAQALGIRLPQELMDLLGVTAEMLRQTLGSKLDQVFPPAPEEPSPSKEVAA
jgi:membrane protein